MNIAQRLLKGSHNIDRMRSEIEQVILIVLGLIDKATIGRPGTVFKLNLSANGYDWQLCAWHASHRFTCIGLGVSEWSSVLRANEINSLATQNVYEGLLVFVELIFRQYPEVGQISLPLLSAADKFGD